MLLNNPRKPLFAQKARGPYLWLQDEHGKQSKVLDMCSGMWNIGLGHNMIDSFRQLVAPTNKYSLYARDRLVNQLCELLNYEGAMLGLNGSDMTDAGLRIAMTLTKRSKILALEEAYHGSSGFAALAGRDLNRRGLPDPLQQATDGGTIGRWAFGPKINRRVMQEELGKIPWSELAAFIFEPVQGSAGGWRLHSEAYEAIAKKCREHGVFIIADEVMTGIGRCGRLALTEMCGIKPDMLALGKMLGNGEPISALLVSKAITNQQTRLYRTGYYGLTHAGSQQACLRALAVLEKVGNPRFQAHLLVKASTLVRAFHKYFSDCPGVLAVRAHGHFFCITLVSGELAQKVHNALLTEDKISVDVSGSKLRFCPLLTMDRDMIRDVFRKTHRQLLKHAGHLS